MITILQDGFLLPMWKMVATVEKISTELLEFGMSCRRYNRVSPILQELHWLPILFCAQITVLLVLTYKALNRYLKDPLR